MDVWGLTQPQFDSDLAHCTSKIEICALFDTAISKVFHNAIILCKVIANRGQKQFGSSRELPTSNQKGNSQSLIPQIGLVALFALIKSMHRLLLRISTALLRLCPTPRALLVLLAKLQKHLSSKMLLNGSHPLSCGSKRGVLANISASTHYCATKTTDWPFIHHSKEGKKESIDHGRIGPRSHHRAGRRFGNQFEVKIQVQLGLVYLVQGLREIWFGGQGILDRCRAVGSKHGPWGRGTAHQWKGTFSLSSSQLQLKMRTESSGD